MAIQQPQPTSKLNSPAHSLSHRVFANDGSAPVQSIVVDSAGRVGIGTTTPAARLDILSSSGPALNASTTLSANTGDEAALALNYTTNKATSGNDTGLLVNFTDTNSPGSSYFLDLKVNNTSKTSLRSDGYIFTPAIQSAANSTFSVGNQWNGAANLFAIRMAGGTYSQTTGVGGAVKITPTYNQLSGDAANTDLLINRTETAIGSGSQYLFDAQVGNVSKFAITNTGNVGIGTTSPTNILSLGGNAVRTFWMERHTTANTAGNGLTIQAGGATAAATDKAGGNLTLNPGVSTGTGESGVILQGCVAGLTGTGDNSFSTILQILGNKLGFYNATPVIKQTGVAVTAEGIHAALVNLGLISA